MTSSDPVTWATTLLPGLGLLLLLAFGPAATSSASEERPAQRQVVQLELSR